MYEWLGGLPNVPITLVGVDGFDTNRAPGRDDSEASLDLEMAISMAPGISNVIVYEVSGSNVNSALGQMANDHTALQISSSYHFHVTEMTDQLFQRLAMQGQSFFQSSGDDGTYASGIVAKAYAGPPAGDAYVTSVGGTLLSLENGGRVSEVVWNNNTSGTGTNGSGGGVSTNYAIPAWQRGSINLANHGSRVYRNIPDVAMAADNILVVYSNGLSGSFWGTSCSAPLWAGFTALINQQAAALGKPPVGFINPAIYRLGNSPNYAAAFHDITVGNNTNSASPDLFYAVPGYDLCTGWGSPNGMNLINALAANDPLAIFPASGFAAHGAVGGPFSPAGGTLYLTNSGNLPLVWSAASDCPWLAVSPDNGTLAPGQQLPVQVSVTASAGSLPEGFNSGGIVFSNVTLGTGQLRQCIIDAGSPPITFDDLDGAYYRIPAGYRGLYWSNLSFLNALDYGHNPSGYEAGMVSAPNVAYNGYGGPATIIGSGPFNFVSAVLTAAWNDNLALEVRGFAGGEVAYQRAFRLSATAPSNIVFNFNGVTSVSFSPSGGTRDTDYDGGGTYFALDNVVVQVPPPTVRIAGLTGSNLNVSGTTTPGAIVEIYNGDTTNGALAGVLTANSTGIYSGSVALPGGMYLLTAVSISGDLASGQSASVPVSPNLVMLPQSQTSFPGGTATFTAGATGAAALHYFWEKDGVRIPGAVNPRLALANLNATNAGTYTVVVSNSFGNAAANAVLTLLPNPFVNLSGTYYGLFEQTNAQFQSSGSLTLTVDADGVFTAVIQNAGRSSSLSGRFSLNGTIDATISLGANAAPLSLSLVLDLTNGTEQIRGVASTSNWTANLQADRAVFSPSFPCPNRGAYTATFASQAGAGSAPAGSGYASVNVNATGLVSVSGVLSDGIAFAPGAVGISKYGQWPFYVPLYSGSGAIWGWVNFTNAGTSSLSGEASWSRPGPNGSAYPAGFTNAVAIVGSSFLPGTSRLPVLAATNLQLTLSGGGLSNALGARVTLYRNGTLADDGGSIPGFAFSINPASGVITGNFTDPFTHRSTRATGIVLQQQTNGAGFFLTPAAGGSVLLAPRP
jgi:hypothetical protein